LILINKYIEIHGQQNIKICYKLCFMVPYGNMLQALAHKHTY